MSWEAVSCTVTDKMCGLALVQMLLTKKSKADLQKIGPGK
jgi:hypothetical protein